MPCVNIVNIYPKITLLRPSTERIVNSIASGEKTRVKLITIIVSDDEMLNNLKVKFFGEDYLTDTISFNYNSDNEPIEGEIYLSIDRIKENAQKFKITFNKELANIIIHSLLHLMGYNDEKPNDRKQMMALQNFYLQQQDLTRLTRKTA